MPPEASDVLSAFHPAVRKWFTDRFDEPTPAQRLGWQAIRRGEATLISAPTGSGKTLAAFLEAIDELLQEGVEKGELPDETRVLYISPLKALSADIHKNLAEPRREIRRITEEMGLPPVRITAAVRSGDTPQSVRQGMLRNPPHILATTPESLYLLLTARKSREMLRSVRTVIVDEIHAVLDSRRGTHLALSLERLQHVVEAPLLRIGLSATQNPVQEVARFLVGSHGIVGAGDGEATGGRHGGGDLGRDGEAAGTGEAKCTIVDEGHLRELDLGIEIPGSPMEAVMSHEVWEEVYSRLAALVEEHRTTLVFVNTRRLAERVARNLSGILGEEAVTAHHGSLSRDTRLEAERRLKSGELKVLVATASLELGIDIGHVDLVCQIGSPRRIATFLQRVGRSGHTVVGTPKGRLFPLTRDDLVECAALLRAVGRGELDRVSVMKGRVDLLAQQIVAEAACEDWDEDALFELVRGAYPYRELEGEAFAEVVQMVSRGFTTRRGRRGAHVHYDGVNRRLRGRKGARLSAITCGGSIPDNADFRVLLEPEGLLVGTVDEDFAIESMPGDIFQLGNTSWRMLRIETGVVRVQDAAGEPPTIPFWFGEAPERSPELSRAVSDLRTEVGDVNRREEAIRWLRSETAVPESAAAQIVDYLSEGKRILGELPSQDCLVLERFFDDAGGMQLVLHAPFGSRVNRAWGLALRKRFCRQFNFELQAAATDEGILLSLGPQHSFPLEDVFRYLHPGSVRELLVQALLDAPMFQVRWRWAAYLSLALLRWRGGSRTPPQIQRMESEDLLSAVFPDANACLETIAGDREVPDHPLVRQAIEDCLEELMDISALEGILERIHEGEIRCIARDTPEPSTLSHELLTARPYAFLDDAPLEERRAHAVQTRRALEPSSAKDLGALDQAAIDRVREEAWPGADTPDELHDALLISGFLTGAEVETGGADWDRHRRELLQEGRIARVTLPNVSIPPGVDGSVRPDRKASPPPVVWIAVERARELRLVHPDPSAPVAFCADAAGVGRGAPPANREEAIRELLRGRLEILGPITAGELAGPLGIDESDARVALHALEAEGFVLRGSFTPGREELEWCDRRLLARIHRYTLNRLRAEIEPVTAADFMRFLFRWQRIEPGDRVSGVEGLASVLDLLDGFELPAVAWEADVLGGRCEDYGPELLDQLCLTGRVVWGRLSPPANGGSGLRTTGPLRSSPIALFSRSSVETWLQLAPDPDAERLSPPARQLLQALERRGASFFDALPRETRLLPTRVEEALGELAAFGFVTSDGFAGLRALLTPSEKKKPLGGTEGGRRSGRRRKTVSYGVDTAGRWTLLRKPPEEPADVRREGMEGAGDTEARRDPPTLVGGGEGAGRPYADAVETLAWTLLRRYGVVFRKVLVRETLHVPWRDLLMAYRRLEARGEIRGGRFVHGFAGEQFALPEAVGLLRKTRSSEPTGELRVVSAADPLNLTGIVTPGARIAAVATNRIGYRDGVPIYAMENGELRVLDSREGPVRPEIRTTMVRRRVPPGLKGYVGHAR